MRRAIVPALVPLALVAACMPVPGLNTAGGTAPSFEAPSAPLERRPAQLPDGVAPRTSAFVATDDLMIGTIALPSGRIVVGEILFDAEPLDAVAAPGAYPVHATLARFPEDQGDSVALLTIVLSDAPTARWADGGSFSVDGGSATITSVETRDHLNRLFEASDADWLALQTEMFESLEAQDFLATHIRLAPDRELALASTGGDGVYPIRVGFDAGGAPTRVALDFLLLEFAWPGG